VSRQDLVEQVRAQVDALGPAGSAVTSELVDAVVTRLPAATSSPLPADQAGNVAFSVLRAATDGAPAPEAAELLRAARTQEHELARVRAELAARRRALLDVRTMSARELLGQLLQRTPWGRRPSGLA